MHASRYFGPAVVVAVAVTLGPIGTTTASAGSWQRCPAAIRHQSTEVYLENGGSVYGSVYAARNMSCRRAFGNLQLSIMDDGQRLQLGNGHSIDTRWKCRTVGGYYDGAKYQCAKGKTKFRSMVGA